MVLDSGPEIPHYAHLVTLVQARLPSDPEFKRSVVSDGMGPANVLHIWVRDGVTLFCLADSKNVSSRVAFSMMNELYTRWQSTFGQIVNNNGSYSSHELANFRDQVLLRFVRFM